jgi:glucosamine--fructose-6-phosphate aminotransferase (isomerizing)
MKSLGEFPDPFLAEIAGQPAALARAAAMVQRDAHVFGAVREAGAGRRVVFTGMGSSYHACYPAVTELGGRGVLAVSIDSAELLHFRRATLRDDVVLVVVSQSGRSAEVVRLLEELPNGPGRRPFVVTVTNGTDNPTARAADVALDTWAGDEEGPSTMTFAGALVVLGATALALAGDDQDVAGGRVRRAADAAARAMDASPARLSDQAAALHDWLGGRSTLLVLGRGRARAASEMGALTLKEAARFPAEALESAQFRHGPMELAGPSMAAAILATDPEVRSLDLGLARELAATGAAVLVVTQDAAGPAGATTVSIGDVDPLLAPAAAIVPLQLLAWRMAVEAGLSPGAYTRASKVTVHE